MNATILKSNVYQVIYTKKVGGEGTIIVKAQNEDGALSLAKFHCFTGKDFRGATQINDSEYVKPSKQGFSGSLRSN